MYDTLSYVTLYVKCLDISGLKRQQEMDLITKCVFLIFVRTCSYGIQYTVMIMLDNFITHNSSHYFIDFGRPVKDFDSSGHMFKSKWRLVCSCFFCHSQYCQLKRVWDRCLLFEIDRWCSIFSWFSFDILCQYRIGAFFKTNVQIKLGRSIKVNFTNTTVYISCICHWDCWFMTKYRYKQTFWLYFFEV